MNVLKLLGLVKKTDKERRRRYYYSDKGDTL